MPHSIVIADDHILIAEAIAVTIENFNQFNVLYTVEHGKALIERFKQPKNIPDIALVDISMPLMDGYETAKWLKEHHPGVLIIALTGDDAEYSLIKMFRAGADGYLVKNVKPSVLEEALMILVEKKMYLPDWATGKILRDFFDNQTKFNDREIELFPYLATELTYEGIGKKMYLGRRGVEAIRDGMFAKVEGVKTRVGLVVYGIKNGYIKLDKI